MENSTPGLNRSYRQSVLAWLHMVRIHTQIAHQENALLAEYGLTNAQFDVLSRLATEPGLNQQSLAGHLLVTKGNVCGLIDRLEAAKLVERRPNPDDRRSHQLYLTDKGQQALEAAAPALEAMLAEQFGMLPDGDEATLMQILGKLDRLLRES